MVHSAEYGLKALERKKRFQNQAIKNNVFKARKYNNYNKKYNNHQSYQKPHQKQQNQNDGNTLRVRGFFKVLPTEDIRNVPQCSHGPCLLFEKRKNGETEVEDTYFACAIYRNNEELCGYKRRYNVETKVLEEIEEPEKKKKKKLFGYNRIPKSLGAMKPEDTVLFCKDCMNVFPNRHNCVCEEIDRDLLNFPTKILAPIDEQNGESQFFFSDESLQVITNAVKLSKVEGVLCIGAPRVFETVRAQLPSKEVFMLDYDKRFAKFYPSKQFAQYSMLVDHFYDKLALPKLMEFFTKCKSILLIVDPPFGVVMEPLLRSIEKMKSRFVESGHSSNQFYSMIVLPIYIRKYVLHDNFWMSDYRVTYESHKLYKYSEKTIVRLFTNLPQKNIDLKELNGYKYCKPCDRYVTAQNVHCEQCKSCTSIEQGQFKHCNQCQKCVKPTYWHCVDCNKCHLSGRCQANKNAEQNSY